MSRKTSPHNFGTARIIVFEDLWAFFNQIERPRSDWGCLPTYQEAFEYFSARDEPRVISLDRLNSRDAAFLDTLDISLAAINANLRRTLNRSRTDSMIFQTSAIRDRCLHAVGPFSGTLVKSTHSFPANLNTIFYRFLDRHIFYLVTSGIGTGFEKHGFYFPAWNLIVRTGERWALFEKEDLFELKAGVVSQLHLCWDYLSVAHRKPTCVPIGFYHFAHHLWNELPGLERLRRGGLLPLVDRILVLREPLGPLEELYPELEPAKLERLSKPSEILGHVLSKGYFVVRIGATFIPKRVIKRVNILAAKHASNPTKEAIANFRAYHFPILWVGIRVGTRAWSDQAQSLGNILTCLKKRFPNLGIILDGFSLPGDRDTVREYAAIVEAEKEVVNRIRSITHASKTGIAEIIGMSIFDAIQWAQAADCYLAPFGSLQHKVGWFAKKAGLIHSNSSFLQGQPDYVWTTVQGLRPPNYVALGSVEDLPAANAAQVIYKAVRDYAEVGASIKAVDSDFQTTEAFHSYALNSGEVAQQLIQLLESRQRWPRGYRRAVMTHRFKKHAKAALKRIERLHSGDKL